MRALSFKRHRFPAKVIRYAVWLYFRFTLSRRDAEELLAERGIEVSYETIRCWTIKFGLQIARDCSAGDPHRRQTLRRFRGEAMRIWSGAVV